MKGGEGEIRKIYKGREEEKEEEEKDGREAEEESEVNEKVGS